MEDTNSSKKVSKNLNVLFFAFFFPPTDNRGVPGCMRTVKFVRSLRNIDAYVVTTQRKVGTSDDALRHLSLPVNDEKIFRVKTFDAFKLFLSLRKIIKNCFKRSRNSASSEPPNDKNHQVQSYSEKSRLTRFKDTVYHLIYLPDNAAPWIIPSVIFSWRLAKKESIDVIFATGSPWSCLVSGYFLSKLTGIPLIADFRDPWTDNPFDKHRGNLVENLNSALERAVVRQASAVSLNTLPLKETFLAKYPDFSGKFFVLPNGFDSQEFANIEKHEETKPDCVVLCHAGQLYGLRDPQILLKAIRLANFTLAPSGKKIIFKQVGNMDLDYDPLYEFQDLIKDSAFVVLPPTTYENSLSLLGASDILVNIQPSTKTQIPSKLYDYLALNKPIINLTPTDGALGGLILEHSIGELFSETSPKDIALRLISFIESEEYLHFNGYKASKDFDIQSISQNLYEVMSSVSFRKV